MVAPLCPYTKPRILRATLSEDDWVRVNEKAAETFKLNVEQFVASENEFAVVLYVEGKKIVAGMPVAGDAQEVSVNVQVGRIPVAVVHSHPNGSMETTDADDRFGEEMASKYGEFRIYVIGYDEDNEVGMSYVDY